jgi:hypothetical protein
MQRLPMPVSDYITDAKTVLDNSLRILQVRAAGSAGQGWAALGSPRAAPPPGPAAILQPGRLLTDEGTPGLLPFHISQPSPPCAGHGGRCG